MCTVTRTLLLFRMAKRPRPSAAPDIVTRSGKPRFVSSHVASLILRLHADQKTHRQIAAITGFARETICRTLADWADTRELAKRVPFRDAQKLSEAAIAGSIKAALHEKNPNPEFAVKILKDIEVLPKDQASATDARVQIVVAMPGAVGLPSPRVRVSAGVPDSLNP